MRKQTSRPLFKDKPGTEFMSSGDWDQLWRRDFLAEGNRQIESRRRYVDWIAELLENVPCLGATSVELGCGTGLVTRGLFDRCGLSSAVLVDFSPEALAIAAANTRDRNIRLFQADVLTWTTDEKFDLAISVGLLEHFRGSTLAAVVRKHADLLRPGGHAVMLVPRRGILWPALKAFNLVQGIREKPLRRRELRAVCEQSGLSVIRVQPRGAGLLIGVLAQKPPGEPAPDRRGQ